MALVRYALTEVLRGRHRTAAAVIGVALAISFLAGTSIAIDSSLRAALDSYLSRLQADFVVSAHTARPMDLADNLTAVRGVASVAVLRTFLLDSIEASGAPPFVGSLRSEEHTSELQSLTNLVCRLLLEKKKRTRHKI